MEPLTERSPRVVAAVKLLRAAHRRKTGTFLVEGSNAVTSALATGRVQELFYTPAHAGLAHQASVPSFPVTERAARALADTVTPPGVVAVCAQLDIPLDRLDSPRLLAVPVEAAEPGNAGTLIRVADAAGADAVVFAGDSVDPHNGKSVRASAGSFFHLPVVRERSVDTVLQALSGLQVLATAADGELALDDAELSRPTAWLFGNEAHGLDPEIAARADHRVRIPIYGRAESLNLATAAAVCLYASARALHGRRS